MKLKFIELVESLIIEQNVIDTFTNKYVGDGTVSDPGKQLDGKKKISTDLWNKILDAAKGNPNRAIFIAKGVLAGWISGNGSMQIEDIYKFSDHQGAKGYFSVHANNSAAYEDLADLGKIKTKDEFDKFIQISKDLVNKVAKKQQGDVSADDHIGGEKLKNLKEHGIKLLGVVDGYQIFEVPKSLKGNKEAWTAYKNILGTTSGGAISLCTIAGFDMFNNYLKDGPYFLIYKYSDPQSPYQFHYESQQFMDKDDNPLLDR